MEITEKPIEWDIIAKIGMITTQKHVVIMMMMTLMQTQCAVHAEVIFFKIN